MSATETRGTDAESSEPVRRDRAAVAEWFRQQLHAAEATGRCPRELWTPWDPRRLAGELLSGLQGEVRP